MPVVTAAAPVRKPNVGPVAFQKRLASGGKPVRRTKIAPDFVDNVYFDSFGAALCADFRHLLRPGRLMLATNRRVLLVDDDTPFAVKLPEELAVYDLEVETAAGPLGVIDNLAGLGFRVVLLSVDLPGAEEFLREVKEFDSGLHVVALSQHARTATALRCLRWGAEACFFKPTLEIEALAESLHATIRKIDRWRATLSTLPTPKRSRGRSPRRVPYL